MARPQPHPDPVRLRFDAFELDEANAWLLRDGRPIALAPTPFALLCTLARRPGTLLSKDALLDAVWGHQFVSESVLKTAVSDLRTALGDDPRAPRFIETVSRRGYRFIAPTTALGAPAAAAPASAPLLCLPLPPSFIGRADVVERLQRAWQRAADGQRAVVWVAGEPGIGKTTVIEQFVAGLGAGVACARGQCVEHHGAGEPYLPVLEALGAWCREDAALPALMRSVAPTWLVQLPWLVDAAEGDALRRELTGIGPERMLREMGELLDRYTEQRPLLLVTEDLHWSDRATIQLIDHVARRRGRARLMWLASFRVAEVVAHEHPLNPLRRELRLHRLCEEMVLDAFSEAEVAAYVGQRSSALAGDEAFVRALHERTDGVPLFVASLVADVLAQGGADAAAAERLAAVAVPDNLAAIIDHQMERLPPERRELLAAAAVCGVDFRAGTVAHALGRDTTEVALACDDLVRGHVWLVAARGGEAPDAAEPAYGFRHALFRQVFYERTPVAARVRLHGAIGAALVQERATGAAVAASVLATHFERGRQPLAALRHYADAAEAALGHFSPSTCLSLTERALALLPQAPHDGARDALELALATLRGLAAFQALGVGDAAQGAFERAWALLPRVPQPPIRARLLHGFGYLLSLRGDYARALEVAERAQALADGSDDPVLMLAACFLRGETHHLQGGNDAARRWLGRGLAIAETLEGRADEVFAADPQVALRGMLAIELVRSGQVGEARTQVQRANARAQALRQPMTRLVAAWQEALVEVRLGDAARVAAVADAMERLVDEYALAQGRAASAWFRGWAMAHAGQGGEGAQRILAAYEDNTALGMRAGASEVLGYAAEALLLAGDAVAARRTLDDALQIAEALGERVYLPQLRLLEAATARAQGRPDAAVKAVRESIAEARREQAPWHELLALVVLCEHGEASADEQRALAELVRRLPDARATAPVRRALAATGSRAID
jgi:DNA-binding winged helix-turn-helix (wHTH) protein/tetratricopeptide (TPR) repeat protein